MSRLHTSVREDAHAYTRSTSPWIIPDRMTAGGKLIHYISGGGMRAFGRTIRQEEVRRRHLCFWIITGGLAVLWTVFWIF